MKIAVIGTGYVGLVSGACLADCGNHVTCIDKDRQKISRLLDGIIPIYERGLEEIVDRGLKEGRLNFISDIESGLKNSDICFITVDTPPDGDGGADLTNVMSVADTIGKLIERPILVVTKSTVPVGTTLRVKDRIQQQLKMRNMDPTLVKVASNPEFLKQGDAVNDFVKPNRVVVGVENGDDETAKMLHELYLPYMRKTDRFVCVSIATAELIKYASNAMLATRVSFINSLARLCEKVGADVEQVRVGMGSDPRIGHDFLFPGLGYGGSCLPKDVKALIHLAREYGETLHVIEASEKVNETQIEWFCKKIEGHFSKLGGMNDKTFAIWGVSFKANTDDLRESRAVKVVNYLIGSGAKVKMYDPQAIDRAKTIFGDKVEYCEDIYSCADEADAVVVCSDWNELRMPDWEKIKTIMKTPVIFDGRNLYSNAQLNGIVKYGVGV